MDALKQGLSTAPPAGLPGTLRARFRARHERDRQSGVAFLITIASLSLLIALVSQFTYGTTVDSAQAANARDEVRAHYLARSALSRGWRSTRQLSTTIASPAAPVSPARVSA